MSDEIFRKLVNSLPELEEGQSPPNIEKIQRDSSQIPDNSSVIVYKMITETYVYTHIGIEPNEKSWYGAVTLQDATILGEMTLEQARTLVNGKKIRRKKQ